MFFLRKNVPDITCGKPHMLQILCSSVRVKIKIIGINLPKISYLGEILQTSFLKSWLGSLRTPITSNFFLKSRMPVLGLTVFILINDPGRSGFQIYRQKDIGHLTWRE